MWANLILIILLMICVVTDVRERKIYNNILLPFFLLALLYSFYNGGLTGFTFAIVGSIVGFSILLVPYFMGGMGAGDVKLLAVIGAIKGTAFVITTAVYMALIGGIIAIVLIINRKGVLFYLKQINTVAILGIQGMIKPIKIDKEALSITFPYGVAIALGAIAAIFEASGGLFK
jgi:prepilin peptidase CpaA